MIELSRDKKSQPLIFIYQDGHTLKQNIPNDFAAMCCATVF